MKIIGGWFCALLALQACTPKASMDPLSAAELDALDSADAVLATAPASLEAVIVVPNAARTWRGLAPLMRMSPDAAPLAKVSAPEFLLVMMGPAIAELVAWDSSFQFAMRKESEEESSFVGSIPLKNFETAVDRLDNTFELQRRGAGYRLRARGEAAHVFKEGGLCELWPVPSQASARLICAPEDPALTEYAAFLSQFSAHDIQSDAMLRAVIPPRTWQRLMQESMQGALTAGAAEAVGEQLVVGMVQDIHSAALEASLLDSELVELRLDLNFQRSSSILSPLLFSSASDAPIPEAFWSLPKDALFAGYFLGMARGSHRDLANKLLNDVTEAAAQDDFDPAGRAPLRNAVSRLLFTGGPTLLAAGLELEPMEAALSDYLAHPPDDLARLSGLRYAASPWLLFGLQEDVNGWIQGIREIIAIDTQYTRARVGGASVASAATAKGSGTQRAVTPSMIEASPKQAQLCLWSELPVPDGWPQSSYHGYCRGVANPRYEGAKDKLPFTASDMHILVTQAQGHTWVCFDPNGKSCIDKLDALLGGRHNLGTDVRLRPYHDAAGNMLAITSARGMSALTLDTDTLELIDAGRTELVKARRLPGRGLNPIAVSGNSNNAPGAEAGTLTMTFRAPLTRFVTWFSD